jgi:hypothetical protein
MVDDFDAYLEELYPDGLTTTEVNDILWFDGDTVLSDLGISDDEDDEDTEAEDTNESVKINKKPIKESKSIKTNNKKNK